MTRYTRFRTAALLSVIGATAFSTMPGTAAQQKFMQDDPIAVERDSQDASGMKPHEPNLFVDFAYNVIAGRGSEDVVRAKNVNTIDEVPDSSWYTNRAGRLALTPADVATGPNTTLGPATGPWTITSSKSDGVTPGFTVIDANGTRWFLKFDPPGFRGMTTGTEVTVTKLMWALGYNVPENHIAYMQRDQLVVGNNAKFKAAGGTSRAMKLNDVDRLLEKVNREPNGTYRVVASKALEGQPIGRIRFIGTRSDDPNDIVEHEHRRELRGYGTFAAWLNHVDAKSINSLDSLVKKDGKSFVRHQLIDFGSALGSGALEPAEYWSGSQYLIEPAQIGKQMVGLGFIHPAWHTKAFYESRSIGRLPLENAGFNPDAWKPREPVRAFLHAREDDKFWAAQKLATLSTELLRAAVTAGDFGDPASEAFLVKALAERRDAVLRAYLPAVNPIADPALSADGTLTFRNAAVDADVARAPREYQASWFVYHNAERVAASIGRSRGTDTTLQAPEALATVKAEFIKVELSATSEQHSAWASPVDVYFKRTDSGWQMVGFERMPDLTLTPTTTD